MNKKPEKPVVNPDEIKKWAGDIATIAKDTFGEVVDNIKASSESYEKKKLSAKYEKDLLVLQPVFKEDLKMSNNSSVLPKPRHFSMPTMIHVVEKDKKHADSKACEHSLGHISDENGVRVLNVYSHHIKDLKELGVTLFPNKDKEFYYVDPYQKDLYIDVQEYFQRQRIAQVNELERLAYALGAKHAEVFFKINTVELEKAKKKAGLSSKIGRKKILDATAEHNESETKKESIELERVIDCSGHDDPQVPELVYFKDDEDIEQLIYMRVDSKSVLHSKECKIKYSSSSVIKKTDAAKLQGALSKMGNASVGASFMEESLVANCTTLIYKIEF
ncbi:MAG: hypothetical protein IJJ01_02845 [Firmicutes bacterium]|nr:hypothetical protein [Bacillota bacterium]